MVDTNGIEYTTMHDYKPTHPKVPKAVLIALEHAETIEKLSIEYIDFSMFDPSRLGVPINWEVAESICHRASKADADLLEARDKALNCKHENTSMTGTMTFDAGDDDIVTVCEDCGRRVGE